MHDEGIIDTLVRNNPFMTNTNPTRYSAFFAAIVPLSELEARLLYGDFHFAAIATLSELAARLSYGYFYFAAIATLSELVARLSYGYFYFAAIAPLSELEARLLYGYFYFAAIASLSELAARLPYGEFHFAAIASPFQSWWSDFPIYPGDTRPEFKMWGGASKSVFVLVLKICQHQFASKTLSC